MTGAEGEDLLQLLGEPSSPFGDYMTAIANRGLRRYRAVLQTGAKAGQSLYTHVLDGVSVLEVIRHPLKLDDEEARCLYLAYSVHDLNKLPDYDQKLAYRDLASAGNVGRELERIGADDFLPVWRDYLADITALCRLHQGHLAVDNTGVDRQMRVRYRLGWRRIERLGYLMHAVDVLDLSHDLTESKHKAAFLRDVNAAATGKRYRFVHHRLAENRGILSNLVHQVVADSLYQRLGAVPLLYYPDGTVYLVEAEAALVWTPADEEALVREVEQALRRVQGRSLEQFVAKAQNGYRVDSAALESGATPQAIMALIREKIERNSYGERSQREQKVRQELVTALPGFDEEQRVAGEELLAEPQLLPDDEQLRVGELAQAYRNFLDAYLTAPLKARKERAWQCVYRLLDLPAARWPLYEAVHGFRRAYFMARDTTVDLDKLMTRIAEDLVALGAEGGGTGGESFVTAYLHETLTFSFAPETQHVFAQALQRYSRDQHKQCCYCGSAFSTVEWMKANVPPNVGVQVFSNRLVGGGGEPKRRVCPLCRTQFILEKLAWISHGDKRGDEQCTFYLHLFPYSFFTEPFLNAWRREVQRLLAEDVTAAMIDTGRWLQAWREERGPEVHVNRTKVNGMALPRPETVSNTPVLAVNAPGENYGAQFLVALEHAAVLGAFFGCRLILSRTAVPILPPADVGALVVDGVPSALDWLVHGRGTSGGALDESGVARLIGRLSALHALHQRLWDRDLVLELARAANDNPLAVFFVADRAIEDQTNDPSRARQLALDCAPYLDELVEEPMTQLRTLAQIAVDGKILGGRGKIGLRPRNALLKPLHIVFDLLQRHPDVSRDDLEMAATEDVFSHLQRIASAEYKPGAIKAEKVSRYVQQFLEGVLGEMYGGDLNRLVADERFVRSAYLGYVRQGLAAHRDERAAAKDTAEETP